MKIGIIGAMEPEVEELRSELDSPRTLTAGCYTYTEGQLCGRQVVITRCGIGKVSAAACTAVMITEYRPDLIINTGSAGGIGAGLKISDIVFSTRAAHHDVDATIFGYKPGQVPEHDQYFDADSTAIKAAERAAAALKDTLGDAVIHRGAVISGDQFISSPEKKHGLLTIFPDALATEMEGAAIAQVCHDCQVPFLIIRAISDCAEEGKSMTFEEFLPIASRHSAALVRALLKELPA